LQLINTQLRLEAVAVKQLRPQRPKMGWSLLRRPQLQMKTYN
jgi:hypothetical protein